MSQGTCRSSSLTGATLRSRSHAAQRYIERKLNKAKHFVASSKAWLNAIPTKDTDVVVLFPPSTDDSTLEWLLSKLKSRVPALQVQVVQHASTKTSAFYLTTSYPEFLLKAEQLGFQKPLKPEFGGGYREFCFEDQDDFLGIEDAKHFLSSLERQTIIRDLLMGLKAQSGDELGSITFLEERAIISELLSKKVISQVFPLHDVNKLEELHNTWITPLWQRQPLGEICGYFGLKIALYFAWLGHYTRALVFPAIVGIAFFVNAGTSEFCDDVCFVLFAFLNILWATVYLEFWKRRSSELSFKWGTLDMEDDLIVQPRPLYKGLLIRSPVTGKLELFDPPWKSRIITYCVGLPITVLCLVVTIATAFLFFEFQEWLNSNLGDGLLWTMIRFLPKIMLAIVIIVYEEIYKRIAVWINDQENFRLDEEYENHLIVKLTLFHFVNSFASLFYVAFYLQDMSRLRDLLATLLITRQIIGNMKEMLLPLLHEKISLLKFGYSINKDLPSHTSHEFEQITTDRETDTSMGSDSGSEEGVIDSDGRGTKVRLMQAEVEGSRKQYDDAFDDYLEMFVQFGYVTFFSSAFPLAALCALVNNLIEIRSDAFKLCKAFQRPFGKSVKNIGTWQDALMLMSTIAVMINCVLIGQSGLIDRLFPSFTSLQTLLLIIALEHVLLAVKFGIAYSIPDVPFWIKVEMAKMEFKKREAFKKVEQQLLIDAKPSCGNPRSPKKSEEESSCVVCPNNVPRVIGHFTDEKSLDSMKGGFASDKVPDNHPCHSLGDAKATKWQEETHNDKEGVSSKLDERLGRVPIDESLDYMSPGVNNINSSSLRMRQTNLSTLSAKVTTL